MLRVKFHGRLPIKLRYMRENELVLDRYRSLIHRHIQAYAYKLIQKGASGLRIFPFSQLFNYVELNIA